MHSESLVDKKKKNPGNIDSTKISSIEKKNVKVSKRKSSFFSKLDYTLLFKEKNKDHFTQDEIELIKFHLLSDFNDEYRKEVKIYNTYFQLWLIASGAKKQILSNKNYYKDLQDNYPKYIPSPYQTQIECDLNRTFPTEPFFQKEENINKLRNILLAYSHRNISVGYCQGFNFIAGRLLQKYNNEVNIILFF